MLSSSVILKEDRLLTIPVNVSSLVAGQRITSTPEQTLPIDFCGTLSLLVRLVLSDMLSKLTLPIAKQTDVVYK